MEKGFKSLKALQDYTDKYGRFQEGDYQYVDEEGYYLYRNSEWHKVELDTKGIKLSLYELNKQIMSQLDPFTLENWQDAEKQITEWESNIKGRYYMLLCKEKSYYTVFVDDGYEFHNFGQAIRECLEFVGNVVSIEYKPNLIEFWIKDKEDTYCMYLFNYDEGVVSFKR